MELTTSLKHLDIFILLLRQQYFKYSNRHLKYGKNDDTDDDEDKCVYVVRKCVWEYGS